MAGRAIIIGAGINGLASAVALQQIGIETHVFEKMKKPKTESGGILLTPNAMAVLEHYKLAERLYNLGPSLKRFHYNDPSGTSLMRIPITGRNQTHRTLAVHRQDLWNTLHGALKKGTLHPGKKLVSFKSVENTVMAHFQDGSSTSADALIGADGLNSTVYQNLFGHEELEYAGYICWRGVCSRSELVTPDLIFESSGHGHRFGATNVGGGLVCTGTPASTYRRKQTLPTKQERSWCSVSSDSTHP